MATCKILQRIRGWLSCGILLLSLFNAVKSSSLHCAVRHEISPCTCRQEDFSSTIIPGSSQLSNGPPSGSVVNSHHHPYGERIEVECERMESFNQLTEALQGKFSPEQQIQLRVSHSQLKDISKHGFKDLRMSITRLDLNYDNLGILDEDVFAGLGRTQYLSLADNEVPEIPRHILSHLTLLRTLDLSRNQINRIDADDFKYNPTLQYLLMNGNSMTELTPGSLPPLVKQLHVGRNHLASLNRTLRDLNQLEWLFINSNELTSLDGELPSSGHNLKMIYAVDNKLTHLSTEFRYLHRLESLFLQHNKIRALDGALQKSRRLKFLELSYNELEKLAEDDLLEAEMLEELQLGHNTLRSLGGDGTSNSQSSLYPLKSLKTLNLTHNDLQEFSFATIRGLRELRLLDLSNNKINRLLRGRSAPAEQTILSPSVVLQNLVEEDADEASGTAIQDMRFQHNKLTNLEGSLFVGMKELQRLNLSHNALGPTIELRNFRGLDGLRVLDLSYNLLTSLEDASETWLPSLEELNAAHNRLVTLSERDFRGFPGLCWVDFTSNIISTVKPELVANTRCTVHGVPDVLRIYLQDNPVLCDAALADLTVALEVNHAKIHYVASDCPAPSTTTATTTTTTTTTPMPTTTTTTTTTTTVAAASSEVTTETTAATPEPSSLPPLPPTLLLAAAAAAASGSNTNVSFAATLE